MAAQEASIGGGEATVDLYFAFIPVPYLSLSNQILKKLLSHSRYSPKQGFSGMGENK